MEGPIRVLAVAGVCALLVACGGGGGGGSSSSPQPAANKPPTVAVLASGQVQAGQASGADFTASVGSELSLSGGSSTDAEGDALSFAWTLKSKPAASSLQLAAANSATISFTPDFQGRYEFDLRVTDSRGAYADKSIAVLVDNTAPLPVVLIGAIYSVTPTTHAPQEVSIGAIIVLDATNSTDPDGDPVTTAWSILERPSGSAAALTINGNVARFVADVPGRYSVMARGQDPMGAYSETIYLLDAANHAPNAVLVGSVTAQARDAGQTTLQASIGYTVVLDGTSSSDVESSGSLTRSWSMLSRPAASSAALSAAAGNSTQLVPDALGNYVVRLTVTDPAGASSIYTVAMRFCRPARNIT